MGIDVMHNVYVLGRRSENFLHTTSAENRSMTSFSLWITSGVREEKGDESRDYGCVEHFLIFIF